MRRAGVALAKFVVGVAGGAIVVAVASSFLLPVLIALVVWAALHDFADVVLSVRWK